MKPHLWRAREDDPLHPFFYLRYHPSTIHTITLRQIPALRNHPLYLWNKRALKFFIFKILFLFFEYKNHTIYKETGFNCTRSLTCHSGKGMPCSIHFKHCSRREACSAVPLSSTCCSNALTWDSKASVSLTDRPHLTGLPKNIQCSGLIKTVYRCLMYQQSLSR